MSTLERRLQILLDQERYDRVAREAEASNRSVAAVIREAIDLRFSSDDDRRSEALRRFLEVADADDGPGQSWEEIKAEVQDAEFAELERKLGR